MTLTFSGLVLQILTGVSIFVIVFGVAIGISLWLKERK